MAPKLTRKEFLRLVQEQMSAFEEQEAAFQEKMRKDRAAELQIQISN